MNVPNYLEFPLAQNCNNALNQDVTNRPTLFPKNIYIITYPLQVVDVIVCLISYGMVQFTIAFYLLQMAHKRYTVLYMFLIILLNRENV